MRLILFSIVFLLALNMNASAASIGVSVSGTCEAGSCPPTALAFNGTDDLPVDFTVTLANGDTYLVNGSFTITNNSNGGGFTAGHLFQVTYEGNPTGGLSAADTVTVQQLDSFQTVAPSVTFDRDVVGAFSANIAASSSATSCVNGNLGCVGPVVPPGSFSETTSFPLNSSGGVFSFDPAFTTNFGAGSPVGSFIVWGQTAPIPPPSGTPEPASLGLGALGLGAIITLRARRSQNTL
jgi:hypothetical protein